MGGRRWDWLSVIEVLLRYSVITHSSRLYEEYGEDYMVAGDEQGDLEAVVDAEVNAALTGEDYIQSATDIKERESNVPDPGIGKLPMAFTLKLDEESSGTCTGVLIHKDWLLSAQHCLGPNVVSQRTKNKKGDWTFSSPITVRTNDGGSITKPDWGTSLSLETTGSGRPEWRKIEQIIVNSGFEGELKSWKGGDLMLLKLAPKAENIEKGFFSPICLPDTDFEDLAADHSDKLFYLGFGRRRVPHCITDDKGPDPFNICGRPKPCTKDHRIPRCGVEFIYQNQTRTKCLKLPTPSSLDPICQKLKEKTGDKIGNRTFVFNKNKDKLLTTCYPFKVKKGHKGWCSTRPPTEDENKEPGYDRGWGFCSESEDQRNCNTLVNKDIQNSDEFPVSHLNLEHCVTSLKVNLQIEKIQADESEYDKMKGLVCIGRNYSNPLEQIPAYSYDETEDKFVAGSIDEKSIDTLKRENVSAYLIDGGACFGDSGGPLYKYVEEGGVKKPVLVGIMSFLLWGTCRGRDDPSYYARVRDYLTFIFKHVPKEEVCLMKGSKKKKTGGKVKKRV